MKRALNIRAELAQKEREQQRKLRQMLKAGQGNSDEFWNEHSKLVDVQLKIYKR